MCLPKGDSRRQLSVPVNEEKTSYTSSFTSRSRSSSSNVSFHPSVLVRPELHIENYTKEEIHSSFYSKEELDIIKNDIQRTVRAMSTEKVQGEEYVFAKGQKLCTLGLEPRLAKNKQAILTRRWMAWGAVFREQDRQWDEGIFDPERIAKAYVETAAVSRMVAEAKGQKNFLESLVGVDKDYNNNDKSLSEYVSSKCKTMFHSTANKVTKLESRDHSAPPSSPIPRAA